MSLHGERAGLAILERINLRKFFTKGEGVTISNYLDERLIVFLDAKSRDDALGQLVDLLDRSGQLKDKELFFHAILEREKIVSTGIGLGVAIPHAKLHGYDDFFIAIGVQCKEGIEWNSLDAAPVRLIFMIGGPDNKQTEYLKILSHLTMAIKSEQRRKSLLKSHTSQEVIALFEGC